MTDQRDLTVKPSGSCSMASPSSSERTTCHQAAGRLNGVRLRSKRLRASWRLRHGDGCSNRAIFPCVHAGVLKQSNPPASPGGGVYLSEGGARAWLKGTRLLHLCTPRGRSRWSLRRGKRQRSPRALRHRRSRGHLGQSAPVRGRVGEGTCERTGGRAG